MNTTKSMRAEPPKPEDLEPEDAPEPEPEPAEDGKPKLPPLPSVASERNKTRAALEAQSQLEIWLPVPPYSEKGHVVQINECNWEVETGKPTLVPESVHQILSEQIEADKMKHKFQR